MANSLRYSQRDFPAYAHVPGVTPHPKKSGGHSEGEADPESYALTQENWRTHEDYLFGIDLHNHGYFWEAHVWWEAVWKATPKGASRDFVQGLIKATAGALKKKMGEEEIALGHNQRAHELMSSSFSATNSCAFGVSRIWWNNVLKNPESRLELESE